MSFFEMSGGYPVGRYPVGGALKGQPLSAKQKQAMAAGRVRKAAYNLQMARQHPDMDQAAINRAYKI